MTLPLSQLQPAAKLVLKNARVAENVQQKGFGEQTLHGLQKESKSDSTTLREGGKHVAQGMGQKSSNKSESWRAYASEGTDSSP